MKRLAVAACVLLAFGVLSQAAEGAENAASAVRGKEFGKALPPIGFVQFCLKNPAECSRPQGRAENAIVLSSQWAQVAKINTSVNMAIQPVSDMDLYGIPEYWTYPTDSGDCEDYLLLKKRMLEKAGFSPAALLITVVLDEKSEGHAVLTVITDKGDYVLDNRRDDVLLWNETGYRFLKRQSRENARLWVALTDQRLAKTEAVSSGE